jgi:L-iditol 2-dehydrogenase
MIAAVLIQPKKFEIKEVDLPQINDTQMLVRIMSNGICQSRKMMWLGKGHHFGGEPLIFPMRPGDPGHEFAAVVEEIGKNVDLPFEPGDKITGLGFTPSFAEYAIADFTKDSKSPSIAVKIPDNIPVEYGLGEPLKCCATVTRYSRVKFGDYVFVAGCGFMGLLIIAGLASTSEVIACDIVERRLELAKELGASVTLNPNEDDITKEVKSMTNGRMCDVAIEGIGNPSGVSLTTDVIKSSPPPGTIILYGLHNLPGTYDLSMWAPKSPEILSIHPPYTIDPLRDLKISMNAVKGGIYPLERLITHKWKLSEINEAHEVAYSSPPLDDYIKGIIIP